MANRFLGEATAQGPDGTAYTLRLDFNAMCAFEDLTGLDSLQAFADFEKGKISAKLMRAMMLAMMRHHHPDATAQDAGELLSVNIDALKDVMSAAMPAEAEVVELGKPKARAAGRRG